MQAFEKNCNDIFNCIEGYRKSDGRRLNIANVIIWKDYEIYRKDFEENEMLHDIRSISKLITCLAVGIAIDKETYFGQEKLSMNTFVWPLISNKVKLNNLRNIEFIKKIQIHHLLNHTIGFDEGFLFRKDIESIDKDNLLDYIFSHELKYEPGKVFRYTNVGTFIISILFLEYLGVNLSDYVNLTLFKKLDIETYE